MHDRASASSRIFRFLIRNLQVANLVVSEPSVITASLMGHIETCGLPGVLCEHLAKLNT
jgi:hypothetical protein